MPYVMLRDAFGSSFHISTRNRATLQAWFDEWLPVLYPADLPEAYGDPVISQVFPLFDREMKNPDWTQDSRYLGDQFRIPRDPALALKALDDHLAGIERQIAGRNEHG